MQELTLEREFKIYEMLHKRTIVKANLIIMFDHLQKTGVNIPSFMDKSAEEKAEEEIDNILDSDNGIEKFNALYEKCWNKNCTLFP